MYVSPIEKIYGEIQTQMAQEDENMVMKAIRKVGINVDKEELIKALQYDRNQYTKGYKDGKNDVLDKIRTDVNGMYRVILKNTPKDDWSVRWNDCLDDVLQIIDKYTA